MNVLITGVAGFIGSHAADAFLLDNAYSVIGVDKFTYAAKEENIFEAKKSKLFKLYKEDICNLKSIKRICEHEKIEWIINFAAETHVDNSIESSEDFLQTNINGVVSLLEVCRLLEINLLHISTDEVYGSKLSGSFKEDDKLDPRNPYSATKASAEHLIKSYENTHGVKNIIVRPSNNFGPRQHSEKFLPTILTSIKNREQIPIYGKGRQIREWLYVKDSVKAIKFILENGSLGEIYNITSNNEMENLNFVNKVYNVFDPDTEKKVKFVKDRPGHDFRYSISNKKLTDLGFCEFTRLEEAIKETVDASFR